MQVNQLILSSIPGKESSQLVARTETVDDRIVEAVAEMLPRRKSLEYGQRESISFFRIELPRQPRNYVFVRSVCGPLDSSNQRQIISHVAVLEEFQFRRFKFHAPNVVFCLRTSGQMSLRQETSVLLPKLDLPDRPMQEILGFRSSLHDVDKVISSLALHDRVGVMGSTEPIDLVAAIFNRESEENRCELSFAVAQRANDNRLFRLYLQINHDADMSREFGRQQIRPLPLGQVETVGS